MMFKIFVAFFLISTKCFCSSDAFLSKDVHIPSSGEAPYRIPFCTTRTSDDGSLKSSLLTQLKTCFGIRSFVETGTYLGGTSIKAAQIFDEVHTIELSPELYLKALHRFKPWENVSVYCGDSGEILEYILPTIGGRILFYLDGHNSGHITAKGALDTPILKELQAIENAKKTDSVILIDDIRVFQDSCFPEKIISLNIGLETYPDLKELVAAILRINSSYQICFLGDALLAFPKDQKVCVSPLVRAGALHRLESCCLDLFEEDLKAADQVIGGAKLEEKQELEIYYQTYAQFEIDFGYRSYACVWYALILREAGDEEKARLLLEQAARNSMPHWRVTALLNGC